MDFFKGIGDFFGGLFGKKKKQNEVDNWNPQPTRLNSQPNTLSSQTDLGSTKFKPSTNFETKPDYSFKTTALTPSTKPFDDTTDFSKDNTSGLNLSLNNRNKLSGNKLTLGGSSRIENTAVHEDDVNNTIKQLNDRYHDERNSFGRFWGSFTGDTDRRDKELRRKIITDEMKKITNGLGSNPDGTYKRDFNDDEAYKMATLQLTLRHGVDGQPLKAFVPNAKMQSNEKVGNLNLGDWGLATARTIRNMTDGEDGLGGLVGNALLGKRKADEGFNLGRFVADLPSGMISGMAETGADISDVLSGKRMLDDGSIQDLNGLQRFGSGLNAALNVGDLPSGGSGTLFRSIFKNGIKQAAKEAGKAGLKEAAKRIAKDLAKDAAKEGLEEGIQQIAQNLSNTDNYDANGNFKAEKLLDQVGESAALGALGGGIMSGAGLGINSGKAKLGELSQNIRQNINQRINPQTNPVQNAVAKVEAQNEIKYKISKDNSDSNANNLYETYTKQKTPTDPIPPVNFVEENGMPIYRGQQSEERGIYYNDTNFAKRADDPGYFFTPDKEIAKKYGNNILETKSNKANTVSAKEANELVRWAGEKVNEDIKAQVETDELIEQMALGRSGAIAEYTGKPFVETGDGFGEKGELQYYKAVDDAAGKIRFKKNEETNTTRNFQEQSLRKIIGNEYDIISKASDNTPRTAQGYADLKNGIVSILDGKMSTANHEATHIAINALTDTNPRLANSAINSIIDSYGADTLISEANKSGYGDILGHKLDATNIDDVRYAAEERLANDFAKYAEAKAKGRENYYAKKNSIPAQIKAWFDYVIDHLKDMAARLDSAHNFMYKLERGDFANMVDNHLNSMRGADIDVLTTQPQMAYRIDPETNIVHIDNNIIEGVPKSQILNTIKKYIQNNLQGQSYALNYGNDGEAKVNARTTRKMIQPDNNLSNRGKLIGDLPDILKVSQKINEAADTKNHSFARDGFEYRKATVEVNGKLYDVKINIGLDNNNKLLYTINGIKESSLVKPNSLSRWELYDDNVSHNLPDVKMKLDGANTDRFGNQFSEQEIPVSQLRRSQEFQPRTTASGKGTSDSVFKYGYNEGMVDQPMLVRRNSDGTYEVLGGHSRTEGLERRTKAGLDNPETVKARVYENLTDKQALQVSQAANQGGQYESILDMAKSISDARNAGIEPSVQRQNMVKGYSMDDYDALYKILSNDRNLQGLVFEGAISQEDMLSIARTSRKLNFEPARTQNLVREAYSRGDFNRKGVESVMKALSTKEHNKEYSESLNGFSFMDDMEALDSQQEILDAQKAIKKQALLDNSLDRVVNNFDSLSSDQQGKILERIKNEKINNNSSNYEAKSTDIKPVIESKNNSLETDVDLTDTEHTETPRQNQPEKKAKNDGNPTRKFIETVLENAPPKDFRQAVEESNGKGKYKVRNTESLWKQAVEEVAKDPLGSFKDIEDARSDKAIAKGIALAEYFKAQGDNASSSAVYIKLAEKATEAGRRVQALSLIKKATPEGMLMNISRQIDAYNNLQDKRGRFAKDKIILDDQTRAYWYQRLQEIYEMPAKTKEQERTKKIAMGQFNKEVSKIFPSKKWDKTMAIWKAGLLSAPTTHIRNIVGNTANLIGEAASNIVSVPTDLIASKFTGIRSTTLKGTKGYGRGLAEGWKTAKDIMHTGVDTSGDVIAKYDSKDVHFDSKLGKGIQAYTDTIFRALNAADKPFKQGMFESSIDSQAYAMAKNKGLKGKEAKAYAEKLIKNPTAEMQEAATVDAEMATFQQSTAMGNVIRGAKNKGGTAGKALDVVTPFTQVPSAVADQAVNYSPFGLIKAVKEFGDVKKAINAGLSEAQIMQLQRKAVKQTGRFITGTALIGAGVILAKNGMLSGAAKDDKERRQWQAEGKMENAVKVGNNWFSLDSIAPELLILNAGGQLSKDLRNSNDIGTTLAKSGLNVAKQFTEQSYMTGLKSGLDAVTDPERSAGKLFGSLATSVIPNAVKKGAQSLDDKQRQVNSLEDSLKASIPGLRNTLPQKYGIYGKPMQNDMGFLETLFSPVRRTSIKENNLANSIDALREKDSDYDKIIPDRPPKTVKIGDGNHTLTAEESSEYQRLMGELTSKYMQEQGFNSESFKKLSDDDKVKILTNIKTDVKGAVENHLFNNKNPEKMSDNKKVISHNLSGGQTAGPVWQTKEEKKEDLYTRKEAEYEKFKKEYEEKSAKGEYSRKSRIEAQNKLRKLEVGKDFTKETRDLYSLGKDDFRNLIESSEDGNKVLDNVLAYGDALVKAGIISRNKFRDRSGNISLSGTSIRGRGGGSRNGGSTPSYKMDTMSLIRGALKTSSKSKASVSFNRKAATKANTQAIKRLNSSKNKR
jgi:hypothetical protein